VFRVTTGHQGLVAFMACVHPDDAAGMIERLSALAIAADGASIVDEFRIVGDDGVVRWARVRGRVSVGHAQPRLSGTIMDVTEAHHLEEELARAHRLESLGRLAGGVAHDFNNLLAAMMSSLDLMEMDCPEGSREDLATIRHAALRARDLTKQLLAFARKQPVQFTTLDLTALVRKVERMLGRLVGPTIDLVIVGSASIFVRADASQLEQVVVNLVVNARDAMPHGGRLEVQVERRDALAILTVSDSGEGMNEETRSKVFDPFFTTKASGTGLGLASIYGIVRQHGGDIVVESTPGHGSRFAVTLPISTDVPIESVPPTIESKPRKGQALVVEDEPLVRATAIRLLKSLGYEVLSAQGAEEALEQSAAHQGRIDVLLCDVAMPGRNGPSVAAELKRNRPDLKVIFVSGYAETDGAFPPGSLFLQKPYTRAELVAKLEEARADSTK
jgi:two-component system, cell cycle sensor histidine kinase and response regulator CckA